MKLNYFLVFLLFAAKGFATKDFPIDKKTWSNQFKVYFSNEFCQNEDWLKQCPKISNSICKDFFSTDVVSSCVKKNQFSFPVKNLSTSLEFGDKTGRCLAILFENKYPTKQKDKSECRNLLKQVSF